MPIGQRAYSALAILFLVFATACGRQLTQPGARVEPKIDFAGSAWSGQLPELPKDDLVSPGTILARRGSIASTIVLHGDEIEQINNGGAANGWANLVAPSSGRAWVMYAFNDLLVTDNPDTVTLKFDGWQPRTAFVAWSDYEAGTWRWTTLKTPSIAENVPIPIVSGSAIQPVSPGGNVYVLIAILDGDYGSTHELDMALDTALPPPANFNASDGTSSSTITLGWDPPAGASPDQYLVERSTQGAGGPYLPLATVAASITTYEDTDSVSNPIPFNTPVAYRVHSMLASRSGPAVEDNGFRMYVWEKSPAPDATGIEIQYASMAIVDGNPAISYYDRTNFLVKYVRALDSLGAAWGAPQTVESTGSAFAQGSTSLAVINGAPAIIFFSQSFGELRYARAADSDGASWNPSVTVDSDGSSMLYACSLYVINGHPAISYSTNAVNALRYVRSTTSTGEASSDWDAKVTVDSGTTGDCCLRPVNGNPAISYFSNPGGHPGVLKFARSSTASGSGIGDWSQITTVDSDSSFLVGLHNSLAVVDGFPAIAYEDDRTNSYGIDYLRATNADGTAWETYQGWRLFTGHSPSLTVINGRPAVGSYENGNTDQFLKYIRSGDADGTLDGWSSSESANIDTAATIFDYVCLTARADGLPAMCYHDSASGELRYAYYH